MNPALKLKPRETSLKLQPEQSRPLLAPFNVAFVPVPPKKKAMGTVLVLLKREEGKKTAVDSPSLHEPKALVV